MEIAEIYRSYFLFLCAPPLGFVGEVLLLGMFVAGSPRARKQTVGKRVLSLLTRHVYV